MRIKGERAVLRSVEREEVRTALKPCHPNGKGHPKGEASQDLGASVMPKGWRLVQLVHAPGGVAASAPAVAPGGGGGETRTGGP